MSAYIEKDRPTQEGKQDRSKNICVMLLKKEKRTQKFSIERLRSKGSLAKIKSPLDTILHPK